MKKELIDTAPISRLHLSALEYAGNVVAFGEHRKRHVKISRELVKAARAFLKGAGRYEREEKSYRQRMSEWTDALRANVREREEIGRRLGPYIKWARARITGNGSAGPKPPSPADVPASSVPDYERLRRINARFVIYARKMTFAARRLRDAMFAYNCWHADTRRFCANSRIASKDFGFAFERFEQQILDIVQGDRGWRALYGDGRA